MSGQALIQVKSVFGAAVKLRESRWKEYVMTNHTRRAGVSSEQRHHMIEEAAYFRAEHEGFGGDALENWLRAEAEIDRMLREGSGQSEEQAKLSLREQLEEQLRHWEDKLEELGGLAKDAGTQLSREVQSQLDKLAEQRSAAQEQLALLREHTAHAWEDTRASAEAMLEELRESIAQLAQRVSAKRKRDTSSRPRRGSRIQK